MRLSLIPACIALAFALAACGEEKTVRADGAADTLTDFVSRNTGTVPKDVRCPEGVEAEVGERFDCAFTGPEGAYQAAMEITAVDGERVDFKITTSRVKFPGQ